MSENAAGTDEFRNNFSERRGAALCAVIEGGTVIDLRGGWIAFWHWYRVLFDALYACLG